MMLLRGLSSAGTLNKSLRGGRLLSWDRRTLPHPIARAQSGLHPGSMDNPASTHHLARLFDRALQYTRRMGSQLAPSQIHELCTLSKSVPLEELGYHPKLVQDPGLIEAQLAASGGHKKHPMLRGNVSYQHLYEDAGSMTLGIFLLPRGSKIPLHNHPDMTVISRLLFGTLRIKAYDLLDDSQASMQGSLGQPGWPWPHGCQQTCVGQLKLDTTVSALSHADPMVLYPHSCNIHVFEAVTPCALLDLLAPPYEPSVGRGCTYYREKRTLQSEVVDNQGHHKQLPVLVELEEYDPPDFVCEQAPYHGIKLKGW